MKEFYISITDENDNFVCSKVPFEEDRLVAVGIAAGGLGDFIDEYKIRMFGNPCEDCDMYEDRQECRDWCDDFQHYQQLMVDEENRHDREYKDIVARRAGKA
jgi:hypothetical protein